MPEPPATPSLALADLSPGDAADFEAERAHDGIAFVDVDLSGVRAHDRDLIECLLEGARLDDAVLTGSRLNEVRFERCEATSLQLAAATAKEVELVGCRFGALDLYDAELRQVRFRHCRLGYLNLRGSHLHDVVFESCQVEDLDFGSSVVERLALVDCTVGHLLLPGAELADVDLRGATLSAVTALDHLRGSTITQEQLADLAPLLAAHLGIEVGEPALG